MLTKPLISVLSPAGPNARLSVLIFHRVAARVDPLFPDDVDVRRFDEICTWLKRWFDVLPLDEAVLRLKTRTLPARAAVITFDDGYRDNCEVALPVLQRHDLCATFFIATGFLDGGCMWNDIVIEAVRRTNESVIDLRPLGICGLARLDVGDMRQKRAAIDLVLRSLKYLPIDQRLDAALRMTALLGIRVPADNMMTSNQVRALRAAGAKSNLFEPDAVTLVFQHSRGIPRLAQNLALNALLAAASGGKKLVDADAVQQALLERDSP